MAQGSLCITDAAKALQVRPKALFEWMRHHGWIYKRTGQSDLGYQDKVTAGWLVHKVTTYDRSGAKTITEQVRVTPKGLAVLAKKFPFAAMAPNVA